MLKLRITFVDDEKGRNDLIDLLNELKSFNIISESDIYKGRGNSKYSNIYVDVCKEE